MSRFSEDTLNNWRRPPSDTEEGKLNNSIKMVKEALFDCENINNSEINIFGQGSYANDTNTRLNSDVDINIKYCGGFYFDLPSGINREDYGLNNPIDYTFRQYKTDVENVLVKKFGRKDVIRKNKCITIIGNTNRIETDVVPTWNYRRYSGPNKYCEGVRLQADNDLWVENFPLQHIENGKIKNRNTGKRFKRLTRIFRKIRYRMIEEGFPVNSNVSSFLLECLLWNVPDYIYNNYDQWNEKLKQSIIYLYNETLSAEKCKEWGEVSELLYLFHSGRKWNNNEVNVYLKQVYNYMGY